MHAPYVALRGNFPDLRDRFCHPVIDCVSEPPLSVRRERREVVRHFVQECLRLGEAEM